MQPAPCHRLAPRDLPDGQPHKMGLQSWQLRVLRVRCKAAVACMRIPSTHRVTHEAAPDHVQGVQRSACGRSRQAGRHEYGQRALGLAPLSAGPVTHARMAWAL